MNINNWKKTVSEANQLFKLNKLPEALNLYQSAKLTAHELFKNSATKNDVIFALVVSYHNLADLHAKNGHKQKEYSELLALNNFLKLEYQKHKNNEVLAFDILKGINKSEFQLMQFLNQHKQYQSSVSRSTLTLN